jgi:hypothetical protein
VCSLAGRGDGDGGVSNIGCDGDGRVTTVGDPVRGVGTINGVSASMLAPVEGWRRFRRPRHCRRLYDEREQSHTPLPDAQSGMCMRQDLLAGMVIVAHRRMDAVSRVIYLHP